MAGHINLHSCGLSCKAGGLQRRRALKSFQLGVSSHHFVPPFPFPPLRLYSIGQAPRGSCCRAIPFAIAGGNRCVPFLLGVKGIKGKSGQNHHSKGGIRSGPLCAVARRSRRCLPPPAATPRPAPRSDDSAPSRSSAREPPHRHKQGANPPDFSVFSSYYAYFGAKVIKKFGWLKKML